MTLPLEGIRVIDTGDVWAGPYCCTLLGDWGAEVIKVESMQRFTTRGQLNPPAVKPEITPASLWGYPDGIPGEHPWNRAPVFNNMNRNKQGITLDLTSAEGLRLFMELVKVSDIVVENYAYGVLAKLGLGYEALRAVNPAIILMSMPMFGNSGPYKHFRGFGNTGEAYTGHVSLRGYADQNVENIQGTVHSDAVSAATGMFALLSALYHRRRTGEGQFLDFGQVEAFMNHLGEYFIDVQMNGRVAGRVGNRDPKLAPCGAFPCLPTGVGSGNHDDRWIALTCRDEEDWRRLCAVMDDPEWTRDARFATMEARKANEDALDNLIMDWTWGQEADELFHQLAEAGIPAGEVLNHLQAYADPHINARGFFEEVTHPEAGTHRYPGPSWKMSESKASIRRPANTLGQHNREVLQGLLGLSDAKLEELAASQVIGTVFLPGSDR
ncbi:MAG: CoA transferase [Chloroflexi bacterium]|nr:CoA transferase [Chloroflexota bacterium]